MLEVKHKIQNSLSLAALVILYVKENVNIVTYIWAVTVDLYYKINSIYLYNICYIQLSCSWFLQQTHFPFPQVCGLTFMWSFF